MARGRIPFCRIFEKFPCFGLDSDISISIITKCLKVFKDPDSQNDNEINFLQTRDISLITRFFVIHGESIRETEFYDCREEPQEGDCICFLKDINSSEAELIEKLFKVINAKACFNCQCTLSYLNCPHIISEWGG